MAAFREISMLEVNISPKLFGVLRFPDLAGENCVLLIFDSEKICIGKGCWLEVFENGVTVFVLA